MSPHNQHLQGSNRKHRQTVRTIPVNKKHRYSGEAEEPWHGPHKPAPWKPWTAKRRLLAESRVRPSPKGWLRHTKQEDGMETGNPVQKYCFLSIKKPVTLVVGSSHALSVDVRKESLRYSLRYSGMRILLL